MSRLLGGRRRLKVDPNSREGLPQHLKILISIAEAAGWKAGRVPYEDIVLKAWTLFPESFSLRNHPEHPDASDVHKRIYQNLKPAGYVSPIGNKIFRLTDSGLAAAQAANDSLHGRRSVTKTDEARLTREEQDLVEHAISSPAFASWRAGSGNELIDYDARLFFQFTTGTPVVDRASRVQATVSALEHGTRLGIHDAGKALEFAKVLSDRFGRLWKEDKNR